MAVSDGRLWLAAVGRRRLVDSRSALPVGSVGAGGCGRAAGQMERIPSGNPLRLEKVPGGRQRLKLEDPESTKRNPGSTKGNPESTNGLGSHFAMKFG